MIKRVANWMATAAGAAALVVALSSCGGRGQSAVLPSSLTTLSFTVDWGERSRTFAGPSSAQSVVVRVATAGLPSGDAVATANRDANPAAHTQAIFTGLVCKSGVFPVSAIFYADRNGTGSVVGLASGLLTVDEAGALQGTLATQGTVASAAVLPGQSLVVGQTKQLLFSARTETGALLVLSPGSVAWSASNGNVTFANGHATGAVVGTSQVTATIDGHASAPVSVSVTWF